MKDKIEITRKTALSMAAMIDDIEEGGCSVVSIEIIKPIFSGDCGFSITAKRQNGEMFSCGTKG